MIDLQIIPLQLFIPQLPPLWLVALLQYPPLEYLHQMELHPLALQMSPLQWVPHLSPLEAGLRNFLLLLAPHLLALLLSAPLLFLLQLGTLRLVLLRMPHEWSLHQQVIPLFNPLLIPLMPVPLMIPRLAILHLILPLVFPILEEMAEIHPQFAPLQVPPLALPRAPPMLLL